MIQMQTVMDVADNSGAKVVRCIKVLGGTRKRVATLGDIVILSALRILPGGAIKKGQVLRGLVVRCRRPSRRSDGSYVRFDANAVVIIDKDGNPRGTRIFGAVARELRDRKHMKIISLASEVV